MLDTTLTRDSNGPVVFHREEGSTWSLRSRQRLLVPRSELFPFFADASNLARLTPPELGFDIVTPRPIVMGVGALIDYRIRLWGLSLDWRTEISEWNPPIEFVDTQLRGPYAEWVHRHRFIELPAESTLVDDHVRFRLPLGRLGAMAGPLVRHQLRRIFAYRRDTIARLGATGW